MPIATVTALALPAYAQQAAKEQAEAPLEVQEVVVTGSRIATPNAQSASPIVAVSAADILATGKTDMSDVLYQLPQLINNDLGQDFSNRTTGLSTPGGLTTADLRGLGPNRTLVLVDGRRLGQGSPQTTIASPAPDLDQIPSFMVERVEVLTGGASSVYGSDAIAGVVNFIMKKNFQGIQVDGQYGLNMHDNRNSWMNPRLTASGYPPLSGSITDGNNQTFSAIMGTNFADNKGNVTAYLSYLHMSPVASARRDYGQCQLTEDFDANGNVIDNHCFGSTNANRFTPQSGPNAGTRYAVVGNQFVPWTGSLSSNPPEVYNSQPFIYMQREDDRYNGGFEAHMDIADYVRPYMDFSFMNDRTHQQIAPSAAFTTSNPNTGGPYFVNCGNPLLSAQEQGIMGCSPAQIAGNQADPANQVEFTIGRRNVEGGGRSSDYEHLNFREAIGVTGNFADAWSYDAYFQYYYVSMNSQNNNYLSYLKIDNALLAVNGPKGVQCVSGAPCVPWNIFKEGGVTPDQFQYLYLLGTASGNNQLKTMHADITGELGKYGVQLPTAHDGIAVNLGWEHRNEFVHYIPDDATNSGQLSGAGGTQEPLDAGVSVSEGFIELRAPLVQDAAFAKDLVVNGGYRHSDYSVSGSVNTWKVDLQWSITPDVRVRGSASSAIRAPSVSELYNPQNIGLIAYGNDPCAASVGNGGVITPAAASLAECLHTAPAGHEAAFTTAYGNGGSTNRIPQAISGQLGQLQGGNPLLQPETSRSYTGGVVFTPTSLRSFTGSIDYWQIRVDGIVTAYPAGYLVNNCLQTGNPTTCAGVIRTTTDFSLQGATVATGGYIVQTNQNIASQLVSGVDLQLAYTNSLGNYGSLLWALNGSYYLHNATTPLPGGGSYDCAGLYGSTLCQAPAPRWRHNLRTTWHSPWDTDLSVIWRFIGKVGNDNNDPNPLLAGNQYGPPSTAFDYVTQTLPNMNYIDLAASWHASKWLDIRAGVNNVFDRQPPIVVNGALQGGGQANTYATYDVLGRQLYAAFTLTF